MIDLLYNISTVASRCFIKLTYVSIHLTLKLNSRLEITAHGYQVIFIPNVSFDRFYFFKSIGLSYALLSETSCQHVFYYSYWAIHSRHIHLLKLSYYCEVAIMPIRMIAMIIQSFETIDWQRYSN